MYYMYITFLPGCPITDSYRNLLKSMKAIRYSININYVWLKLIVHFNFYYHFAWIYMYKLKLL